MAAPSDDRNLLFGILALQMDFIARDALIAAMNAWSLARDRPLGAILVEHGGLDPADRVLLDAVVDRHVAIHEGDPSRSVASTRSQGTESTDLVDYFLNLSTSPTGDDGDPTTVAPAPSRRAAGRYHILRAHKSGGLGRISVARDEELGREVALKEIRDRDADKHDFRARFVLEAEINGNLEHPAIVPVYGKGEHASGRPFYVMRLIQGQSLEDVIRTFHAESPSLDAAARSLRLRDLLGRFITVCQAIAYAHARGVIHRDLKPANVMVGTYGETLLIDWGLAKATGHRDDVVRADSAEPTLLPPSNDSHDPTRAGSEFGTPRYMSPEQAAGRLDVMGPRTDVYGLGATLYCLLTGQPPIAGPIEDVKGKVLRGDIVPPRKAKPNVPRALEAICLEALKLDPNDRYGSAKDLARDIERWLADEPPVVYREPFLTRASRWLRRHKPVLAAALTLLVATIMGLTVDDYRVGRERDRVEAAGKRAEAASKESDANFRLAREAVNRVLFQLAGEVLPAVPQSENLRRKVSADAIDFNQRFLKRRPLDPEVRADAASVCREAATIAAMLGELDQAETYSDQAVELYRGLHQEFPQRPDFRVDLALALVDWAGLAVLRNRPEEAEDRYAEVMRVADPPRDGSPGLPPPKLRLPTAMAHQGLGTLRLRAGRFAEARESSAEACTLFEEICRSSGTTNLQPSLLYARALLQRGESERGGGLAADASFQTCLAICVKVLADGPKLVVAPGELTFAAVKPNIRYIAAQARLGLASLLAKKAGGRPEARAAADLAIADLAELAAEFPRVADYRRELEAARRTWAGQP